MVLGEVWWRRVVYGVRGSVRGWLGSNRLYCAFGTEMGCGLMETVERDHSKLARVASAVGDEFLGRQGIKRMWYERKMGALREIS